MDQELLIKEMEFEKLNKEQNDKDAFMKKQERLKKAVKSASQHDLLDKSQQ